MLADNPKSASDKDASFFYVLCGIVMGGAVLRIAGLSLQSLWLDELSSVYMSDKATLTQVFTEGVLTEPYPPGYHIFLFYWMKAFGSDPWMIRFPTAVAGTITIYVIGLLGKALLNARAGLVAAGITAVTYGPLYFSQEGRVYSFLILFVTLAALQLTRLINRANDDASGQTHSLFNSVLLAIWLLLAALGHYFGLAAALMFLTILGLAAWLVPALRSAFQVSALAFALPYSVWLYFGWDSLIRPRNIQGVPIPGGAEIAQTLQLFFNGSLVSAALAIALIGIALFLKFKSQSRPVSLRRTWPLLLLIIWGSAPPLLTFIFSHTVRPLYVYRNQVIALPAWCLLLGFAIVYLSPSVKSWRLNGLLVTFSLLLQLLFQIKYYDSVQKTQFREATAFLADKAQPGDLVIGHAYSKYSFDYYLNRHKPGMAIDVLVDQSAKPLLGVLDRATAPETVWLIFAHRAPNPDYEWSKLLAKHYRPEASKMFFQAGVVKFKKRN